MKNIVLLIILSAALFSCEDIVQLKLEDGVSQLAVDAWLTDEITEQKIVLTQTQSYFDNSSPIPATGATVTVFSDDSMAHVFKEKGNTGVYTFTPSAKGYLKLNQNAYLYIKYANEEYTAVSKLNRVPKIDSVNYQDYHLPVTPPKGIKDGYLAEFYANDISGVGDTYLIRSYKNDTLRFKPEEIFVAYDAGFSSRAQTDGLLFIQPLRRAITPILFRDKDKVKVELFSITEDAFNYITQLKSQASNGGIFAVPSNNIVTNVFNKNTQKGKKAIGAFFVSKVSRFETVIDKNKALPMTQ